MTGGAGNEKMQEEMREAEEEIAEDDGEAIPLETLEEGRSEDAPSPSPKPNKQPSWLEGARNFSSLIFGPVFVQAFVLTFLGEWGDRSQIATIALGAAHVRPVQVMRSITLTHMCFRTSTLLPLAQSLATPSVLR